MIPEQIIQMLRDTKPVEENFTDENIYDAEHNRWWIILNKCSDLLRLNNDQFDFRDFYMACFQ